jgi:hypothetical protein
MIRFEQETHDFDHLVDYYGFDRALANDIHYLMIYLAPMATGNLARSIRKKVVTKRFMKFSYDPQMARYTKFLERGQGSVKKYKGFISQVTVPRVITTLVTHVHNSNTCLVGGRDSVASSASEVIKNLKKARGLSGKAVKMYYEKKGTTEQERKDFKISNRKLLTSTQRRNRSLLEYSRRAKEISEG